jgi:hypothetical protein
MLPLSKDLLAPFYCMLHGAMIEEKKFPKDDDFTEKNM